MSSRIRGESPLRTCREEKSFESDLAQLVPKYPCIQDVCDSVTWVLSRNPQAGEHFPGNADYWILDTPADGDMPSFRVRYSFDDDMVHLWAIEPTGEEKDGA